MSNKSPKHNMLTKPAEATTTKSSKQSSSSGHKGTKASNGLRRTLQKGLDSVLAAPALQVGQTAPFIPNQVHPLMAAPYAGSKMATHDLHASTLTAAKAPLSGRKHGGASPSIMGAPLSAKCSQEVPCWVCRYVRSFLLLDKLRGIMPAQPPKDRRTRKEDRRSGSRRVVRYSLGEHRRALGWAWAKDRRQPKDMRWKYQYPTCMHHPV